MEVLLSSGTKIMITSSDQLDLAAILISKLQKSQLGICFLRKAVERAGGRTGGGEKGG
jgi:hypothetical protein